MLFGMNPWVFFALFAALLVIGEFFSRKVRGRNQAFLPPHERTLSPRRRAYVRAVLISYYAVIVAGSVAYWLGSDFAGYVLGVAFLAAAFGAVLGAVSWVGSRQRETRPTSEP